MVDNNRSQLVTCGTAFQGYCQSRHLVNISLYNLELDPGTGANYGFVASTDPTHPAVAFVAPGTPDGVRLYVGSDDLPSNHDQYTHRKFTCGVTSRYLNGTKTFQITTPHDTGLGTFAHLSEAAATSQFFIMTYVAGFSVNGFSYFLTTQPVVYPADSSTPRVSKLSQVCQDDRFFYSYVEMPITCRSNSKDYNLVQAATLLQPGSRLASTVGLTTTEHLLLAAFYDERDSALCVYRLTDIRSTFTENIRACNDNSSLLVGPQFRKPSTTSCTPGLLVRMIY